MKAGDFWNNLKETADSFAGSPLNNAAPAPAAANAGPLSWIAQNWQIAVIAAVALLVLMKD